MIKVGEFREGMPLSELIQLAVNGVRNKLVGGSGFQWSEFLTGELRFNSARLVNVVESTERQLELWEANSMSALDWVRAGEIGIALRMLQWPDKQTWNWPVIYRTNSMIHEAIGSDAIAAPLETYEAAAQILAEVGL